MFDSLVILGNYRFLLPKSDNMTFQTSSYNTGIGTKKSKNIAKANKMSKLRSILSERGFANDLL